MLFTSPDGRLPSSASGRAQVHMWFEMRGSSGGWGYSLFLIPRSQAFSLTKPKAIPKKRRRVFRAPDLQGMLQVLQGEESYVT